MIDENTIRQKLDNFVFQSYTKVVARLLSTFGILDTTIAKINSKIEAGESGPFYVYRRAIIYCTEDMTSAEEYSSAKRPCLFLLYLLQVKSLLRMNILEALYVIIMKLQIIYIISLHCIVGT